jgi:hypothetical protein
MVKIGDVGADGVNGCAATGMMKMGREEEQPVVTVRFGRTATKKGELSSLGTFGLR